MTLTQLAALRPGDVAFVRAEVLPIANSAFAHGDHLKLRVGDKAGGTTFYAPVTQCVPSIEIERSDVNVIVALCGEQGRFVSHR
jgi:hypothetical protein